jgi:hypothetical protein
VFTHEAHAEHLLAKADMFLGIKPELREAIFEVCKFTKPTLAKYRGYAAKYRNVFVD